MRHAPSDTRADHSIILGFLCLLLLATLYAFLGASAVQLLHVAMPAALTSRTF